MAEYYSVELAQKIHRGMSINAEKCLSNGSNPGLGFKVNKADRTFYVDEEEAAIVREIFERYASGETKAKIVKDLQRRKVKTSIGNEFTYNSLSRLLKNKRYIGIYLYKGVETPGGMPRILDDDLFYRVQSLMNKNKSAPARTRGENEYLLTTKLFCGHYKEMMVGYGGTGKSGKQYHYYMCKKKCDKKIIGKQYIEDRVVSECLKCLLMIKSDILQSVLQRNVTRVPTIYRCVKSRKLLRKSMLPLKTFGKVSNKDSPFQC